LIDFIINTHPALAKAQAQADEAGQGLFEFLEIKLEELKKIRKVASSSAYMARLL
jgi:ribulose kinase